MKTKLQYIKCKLWLTNDVFGTTFMVIINRKSCFSSVGEGLTALIASPHKSFAQSINNPAVNQFVPLPEFAGFYRLSPAINSGLLIAEAPILGALKARSLTRDNLSSFLPIAAVAANHLSEVGIPQSLNRNLDSWLRLLQEDTGFRSTRSAISEILRKSAMPVQLVDVERLVSSATNFRDNQAFRLRAAGRFQQSFESVIQILALQLPRLRPASSKLNQDRFQFRTIDSQAQSQLLDHSNHLMAAGTAIASAGGIVYQFAAADSTIAAVATAVTGAGLAIGLCGAIGYFGYHYLANH